MSLVVGSFVLAALALLAWAVLSLSSQRGVWTAEYRLLAHFDNVQGLLEGAPVRLAGRDVGRVESVTFAPLESDEPPVRVGLRIDEAVRPLVRSDSLATIGTIGLLGDTYVEVSVGTRGGEVLADGAELPARSPFSIQQVVDTGTEALEGITTLAESIRSAVAEFETRGGAGSVAETVSGLNAIVDEVRSGRGVAHSLIYDPFEGSSLQSIERSLGILEGMLQEIRDGQGILHTLIYEPPTEADFVMQTLEAGARLNSILGKIDRGEGSMGLFLNDPTLYEDLKVLVGGAERSFLLRRLIDMALPGEG